MSDKFRDYADEEIDISYERRCIHAAECVRGLPGYSTPLAGRGSWLPVPAPRGPKLGVGACTSNSANYQ